MFTTELILISKDFYFLAIELFPPAQKCKWVRDCVCVSGVAVFKRGVGGPKANSEVCTCVTPPAWTNLKIYVASVIGNIDTI